MIRMKDFLGEKIYDPDLGVGISSTEYIFEKYYKSRNPEDYFISFTQIDKLGINPRSEYNTPLGIYTYPVEEFFEKYIHNARLKKLKNNYNLRIGEFAPFAGDTPYAWVIKVNRNAGKFIDDIGETYTKRDFEEDIDFIKQKLIKKDLERLEKMYGDSIYQDKSLAKVSQQNTQYDIDKWKENARDDSYGGQMWNITRNVVDENPVRWNALWREMGYIGVADRSGFGIIHPNEKTQAVFFSIKSFRVMDKVENIEASHGRVIDRKEIEFQVKKHIEIITELADMDNLKDLLEQQILKLDKYLLTLTKKELEIAKEVWDKLFIKYVKGSAGKNVFERIDNVIMVLQRKDKLKRIVVMYGGNITLLYMG